MVILLSISIPLIIYIGLSNIGALTRSQGDRYTGIFVVKGYDVVATTQTGEKVEVNITFGLFYYENESQYATDQRCYKGFEITHRSYLVVESFVNGTPYNFYLTCEELKIPQSSSSKTFWVPLTRRANPGTWNANLTGDISQCANLTANTNETMRLQFDIPENDLDYPGGCHYLHLGFTKWFPNASFASYFGQTFDGAPLRGGSTYPGCKYTGLWLKLENATLNSQFRPNARNLTVNGIIPSFIHIANDQVYIKLDNLFLGTSGFERYNWVSIGANFADIPDCLRIWDGFIGDEAGGYVVA